MNILRQSLLTLGVYYVICSVTGTLPGDVVRENVRRGASRSRHFRPLPVSHHHGGGTHANHQGEAGRLQTILSAISCCNPQCRKKAPKNVRSHFWHLFYIFLNKLCYDMVQFLSIFLMGYRGGETKRFQMHLQWYTSRIIDPLKQSDLTFF